MTYETLNAAIAFPEIMLAVAAMLLLVLGVFRGDRSASLVSWGAVIILLIAIIPVMGLAGARTAGFNNMFVVDSFVSFMKVLVLLGSALGIVMSVDYNRREGISRPEFPVLILLATVGMMIMISAGDLISLYVGLELQSLSLYVVAAFQRDSVRSTEAGLKYFVLGALSSGMLLYGASLVYGFAGTTSFKALSAVLAESAGSPPLGVIFGIVFVAAGLAFKVAAAPFHMWTPDVYEGAPTPVTAFFAIAPKMAAVALFVRVMVEPFGPLIGDWQQIIVFVSIASMLIGAFAAIWQTNIKRLMAYSSIGHVGYALIGLAAGSEDGIRGVLIYMAIYLFMNVGTFAVILSMRHRGHLVEQISDLSGLAQTHKGLAAALAIAMFAMAGIPPLAGFFSKLFIFQAAVAQGLYALAVIGVLTSVVGAFYYMRIVKVMYFDAPGAPYARGKGALESGLIALAALLVSPLGYLLIGPLGDATNRAAGSLF
jgi:NADH-quinone oxidoreductase subunit N